MENKYKAGEAVYRKMLPDKKMIVSRYANKLYHCTTEESPRRKEWLYFEKELMTCKSN
jgi:hypothetical protein